MKIGVKRWVARLETSQKPPRPRLVQLGQSLFATLANRDKDQDRVPGFDLFDQCRDPVNGKSRILSGLQDQSLKTILVDRLGGGGQDLFITHPVTLYLTAPPDPAVSTIVLTAVGEFDYPVDTTGVGKMLLAEEIGGLVKHVQFLVVFGLKQSEQLIAL